MKETLTFHLTTAGHSSMPRSHDEQFSKEFVRSLGLKVHSGCWGDLDLDSNAMDTFLERAAELIESGQARFFGLNSLSQTLQCSQAGGCDWYSVEPNQAVSNESTSGGLVGFKADKIPVGTHVVSVAGTVAVSSAVRHLVEEQDLRGADFLWIRDPGKHRALEWFFPVANHPMGRGLDHPWFDPATLRGSDSFQPRSPRYRTGVWNFDLHQTTADAVQEHSVHGRLFDLYRKGSSSDFPLVIHSHRRFLREYLPKADFAYIWSRTDSESGDLPVRPRGFCVSERARDLLVEHRLIAAHEFKGIEILDSPERKGVVFDGEEKMPPSVVETPHLEKLQDRLRPLLEQHRSSPKPVRVAKLKEALSALRKAKKARPADFMKGATKTALKPVQNRLPTSWLRVLKITNGGHVCLEVRLVPVEDMQHFGDEKEALLVELGDVPGHDTALVPVAAAPDGDWFSLITSDDEPSEGVPVARVTHEGATVVRRWDSVAAFLSDALNGDLDDEVA